MTILKIKFNEDVRRITLETVPSFSELQTVLRDLFRSLPETFTVKYTDEEEDLISMCSDMEMKEAWELTKQSPTNILRLSITADNSTAPFVVNQRDVSLLSANALRQLIDSPGFQQLIVSPGFQQLLPAIIDSPGFRQKLVPQVLHPDNIQRVLPSLTNVSPAATTLFEAMIPMLLNSSLQQQSTAPSQAPVPTLVQIPASSPTIPTSSTFVETAPTTTANTQTSEVKKDIIIDSKSFDCDSFEVVEISSSTSSIPSTNTSLTSLSDSAKQFTNSSASSSPSPSPSTSSTTPIPSSAPAPAPVPEIPEAIRAFVETLVNMGFSDIQKNVRLLEENQGNLCRVIEICLEGKN